MVSKYGQTTVEDELSHHPESRPKAKPVLRSSDATSSRINEPPLFVVSETITYPPIVCFTYGFNNERVFLSVTLKLVVA
jgi:hypothetical protein